MKNKMEIFKNEEFGEVRTTNVDNKPYVCLADVCKILEIKNVSQCKERLNQKGICITDTLTAGGKQQMIFINESNLYKVIFQSRKQEAEKFTDWVTNDVLPSIRKHGMYATDELLDNPDFAIKILEQLKAEREEKKRLQLENLQKEQIIGELKSKADYTDRILQNKGLVTITAIAKDYGMSGPAMNKKLHELHIQYKQSNQWLLYEKYQDKGYTHSETIDLKHKNGNDFVRMNTKWTQKGRLFLYELLKDNGLLPMIEREV